MMIRRFQSADGAALRDLIASEGNGWEVFLTKENWPHYLDALESCLTYVAFGGDDDCRCDDARDGDGDGDGVVCGYIRCREDFGFGIYIFDLLVRSSCRGKSLGAALMERVVADYPDQPVYVMSDIDGYYEKLGYQREGSIFVVREV